MHACAAFSNMAAAHWAMLETVPHVGGLQVVADAAPASHEMQPAQAGVLPSMTWQWAHRGSSQLLLCILPHLLELLCLLPLHLQLCCSAPQVCHLRHEPVVVLWVQPLHLLLQRCVLHMCSLPDKRTTTMLCTADSHDQLVWGHPPPHTLARPWCLGSANAPNHKLHILKDGQIQHNQVEACC
jgi:hypothetical protein